MTRSELLTFIEAGASELVPYGYFDTGRNTSLNAVQDISYPYVWLVSPGTAPDLTDNLLLFDNWNVELHIGKQDKIDSVHGEYEAIVNECDMYARKLIQRYNQVIEGYATASISGLSIDPFIKQHSRCETGVVLSFTINAPDTSDLC